ncbi:MAG TPA: efflux RND transporter periplasmic adaptor subunit [Candidatus Polarisedimenticolia bacterium]|nr:efflux RND transporter periplasmic adaptor subunit [Candidatus Polarisedimenticolia bacterium]
MNRAVPHPIASLLAPCVYLLALLAAACGSHRDPAVIFASGHVEATDVRVSTKVGGRLEWFPIQEGDRVTKDQVIARLDTTDTHLALLQARAERDQASADLRLRIAGARTEDIAELEAQVASLAADLEGAQRDLDRMQALLDKGSGTTKARDDARTRRDVTAAKLAAMRESLARMRAGSRREEIEAARARLAAAEARIARYQQQVDDATIDSPTAGVITAKIVEPGELLAPGASLCVVTDLSDAWLTVYVGEPDLGRMRLGQEAEVKTDDGQKRRGHVTFIASEAEFTPRNVQTRDERVKLVFKVKIGLDNQDGLFKPGMPAEARLRSAPAAP